MLRLTLAGFLLLFASAVHAQTPAAPAADQQAPVETAAPERPAPLAASSPAAPTSATTASPIPQTRSSNKPPERPKYLDYRGYLLASDAAALILFAAAATTNSEPLAYSGLGVYAVGGPTIHLLEDQPLRAAESIGLRFGLPLGLGLLGLTLGAGGCHTDDGLQCLGSTVGGGVLGFASGMVVASLIDDIALGRVKLDEPRPPASSNGAATTAPLARTPARYRLGISPFVAARGQGAGVMAIGAF